jgi:hypothetical protein
VGLFFGREYVPSSSAAYYYGQWGIQYVPASPASNIPVGGLNFWKPFQSTGNASGQNALLFLNDDGKVGIGTLQPHCGLDIHPPADVNGTCVELNHTQDYGYGIVVKSNRALTQVLSGVWNNTENFVVYADGYAFAREFNVTNGIFSHPDYVFEEGYRKKMLNIDELEHYVKKYKHLPGMPSAKEIEKQGYVPVGELLQKHLEKIEELSLYIIELKKEIEELKKSKK